MTPTGSSPLSSKLPWQFALYCCCTKPKKDRVERPLSFGRAEDCDEKLILLPLADLAATYSPAS